MDFLTTLNQDQRQAVEAKARHLLIVAGPGTGKTKTLTARIAHLVRERSVDPADILALTFTNKAAREMRDRAAALLPGQAQVPEITTFHAYGHALLARQGELALTDEGTRIRLIRNLSKPAAYKGKSARELSLVLSKAKTSLSPLQDDAQLLVDRYNAALKEQNLVDFDDLLIRVLAMLQKGDGRHYGHVLVDEFQDTNELQYELLRSLSTKGGIFAIGDPNQSIYGFRGAGAHMFDRFRRDFPHAKSVALTINYRSVPQVVTAANAIFPQARPLQPHTQQNGRVRIIETLNEYGEAAYILRTIEEGIGGSSLHTATTAEARGMREFAVLYRTHRAAQALRHRLQESGIPYQIAGEDSPYEQPRMQALIALLRYRATKSDTDHHAVLAEEKLTHLTASQLTALLEHLPGEMPVCDLALQLATLFDLWPEQDQQDLRQFSGMLVQFGSDVAAAVAHLENIRDQAFYDPTVDVITLLTIHASKGLEFEHVFLCAAEEGILPKIRKNEAADIEEERRLFYVAVTRARRQLDVLYARRRNAQAAALSSLVSALPKEVAERCIDPELAAQQRRAEKYRQKKSQISLF